METLDVYTIQTLKESSFSCEELLFIALLHGGDYDLGLTGCGITTAVNLKQVGFGKHLVQAWNNRHNSLSEWIEFLSVWRSNVKNELMSNVSGNSGQVNRTAANSITYKFPRYEVLAAYLDPEQFDDYELQYISQRLWKTKINLLKLVVACLNQFQWSTRSKILTTFQSLVWPGAVMRLLLDVTMKMDAGIQMELAFTIIPVGRKPKTQINCVSIQICTASFIQAMEDGLSQVQLLYSDTITFHWEIAANDMIINPDGNDNLQCFWIPHSIIASMCSQHKYLNNMSQQNVQL
ncbi:hypothetical protein Clacol_003391 [Clathrus columnatus]|uniref:Uncharacterized protein n=1 Tax=Clathrus columnatus TaxID=1419009 RepID=A0AAV5A7E6_9AGAM|nr:hypothetical protein Clacol_003391 [Clathrus columnatus]